MKKIWIFLILSFLPIKGNAVVCEEPLICIKKESQVCVEQNMIHLGDDDCVECGCPDGGENKGTEEKPICCKNGNLWSSVYKVYSNARFSPDKCGCPEGGELKEGNDWQSNGLGYYCCKNQKKWDIVVEKYERVDLRCGCPDEFKRNVKGRELCCREEPPDCEPGTGVPITGDIYGNCECGCKTDDDCNITPWYKSFMKNKKRRECKNSVCVPILACYQFDNLTIELDEVDDHELKAEHLPALADKLKSELELGPDEHVTLSITTMKCPGLFGFLWLPLGHYDGASKTIYINIDQCCETSEGEWSCEGTVLHENEHRQDFNQPIWQDLKSTIAKAYFDNLTEINAHAKGDIKKMIQRYKVCYPESNNFKSVCTSIFSRSEQCKKCAKQIVPGYLEDYDNPEYAKMYHDDPNYFDPDGGCKDQSYNTCQCHGIRLEFERKYINSSFAKNSYIAGQAVENAMCGSDTEEAAQQDLKNIIEALAECEGWDKPPEEDLTDLPKLIAQLYKEKNELCMPAEEIANNINIAQGLEKLKTCSVIKDFLTANANADLNNLPTTCERKCETVTLTIR